MKSGSPSRTTAAHKTQTKIRPGPLSSSTVVTPHLTLPKLLRGIRDRWVAQVSFIIIHSTGLAPFPRLSPRSHSSHTSIAPRRPGGGTHETAVYSPLPPSRGSPSGRPWRDLGVRTERGERKGDGMMRSDREEKKTKKKKHLGPVPGHTAARPRQPAEWLLLRGAMRWYWTSLVDGFTLLRLLVDGDGSSSRG